MSAQVCPVCGGKGLVPNGFYLSVGTDSYRTNSTAPETCRSCGGKDYIIEFPDSYPLPVYNSYNSCTVCNNNDGKCYTSYPPQYKCTIDGEFHTANYSCDKFDDNIESLDLTCNNISTNSNRTVTSPNANITNTHISKNKVKLNNTPNKGTNVQPASNKDNPPIVICTTDAYDRFPDVSKYIDTDRIILCKRYLTDEKFVYSRDLKCWLKIDLVTFDKYSHNKT